MSRLNLRPKRSSRYPPVKPWKIEITKKCLKSWFHPSVGIPHQVLPATTPELSTSTLPRLNCYTTMSTTSCLNPVKTFGLDLWCMNNNPLSYVIIAPEFWFNKTLGAKKTYIFIQKSFPGGWFIQRHFNHTHVCPEWEQLLVEFALKTKIVSFWCYDITFKNSFCSNKADEMFKLLHF